MTKKILQAVQFDKDLWPLHRARNWLDIRGYRSDKASDTVKHFIFTQSKRDHTARYYMITGDEGIDFVVMADFSDI